MTDDLEAKARELLMRIQSGDSIERVTWFVDAFRSVAAEARKDALVEAEQACREVEMEIPRVREANTAYHCAQRIRALAGRKEGT